MRIIYLPILFLTILFQTSAICQSKVDQSIYEQLKGEDAVHVIIDIKGKADLKDVVHRKSKIEKRTYVFSQLIQVANQRQSRVKEYLTSKNIHFKSFYINNSISADLDLATISELVEFDEVEHILLDNLIQVDLPEPSGQRVENRQAIESGITHINADDVWAMGITGSGVVVSGQDSGYEWDHPALKDKYRGWDGDMADHDYNWHDAISVDMTGPHPCGVSSTEPCDDNGHGTHTMGIMVGDDELGNQIGVAPGAEWIGCRSINKLGAASKSTFCECFEWFLAPYPVGGTPAMGDVSKAPDVINNSWLCRNSSGCDEAGRILMETAIDNLKSAGTAVVVAAGNAGPDCTTIFGTPQGLSNTLLVGNLDAGTDSIFFTSSRGPSFFGDITEIKPHIVAPGAAVRSSVLSDAYGNKTGTSMASPHVVGTVALMLDAAPSLSVSEIETILKNTARSKTTTQNCNGELGTIIPNHTFGYGALDALAAVTAAMATLPVDFISFEAHFENETVLLSWATASEINNEAFDIEKSDDGLAWHIISSIPGKRYSLEIQEYSFVDEKPWYGITSYYRLKQRDFDGAYDYSSIQTINLMQQQARVRIYPNPSKGNLNFSLVDNIHYQIFIYNNLGQLTKYLLPTDSEIMVTLPDGIFNIQIIENNSNTYFQRIIVH